MGSYGTGDPPKRTYFSCEIASNSMGIFTFMIVLKIVTMVFDTYYCRQ